MYNNSINISCFCFLPPSQLTYKKTAQKIQIIDSHIEPFEIKKKFDPIKSHFLFWDLQIHFRKMFRSYLRPQTFSIFVSLDYCTQDETR
jgi:hypothetical protein